MTFMDFYDIAQYANANWKCHMTEREIVKHAYELWDTYQISDGVCPFEQEIETLIENLEEDYRETKDEQVKEWLDKLYE